MTTELKDVNDVYSRLRMLRDAGAVTRSHTCRRLMDRNVAEHSYGVAMIILELRQASQYLNDGFTALRADVVYAALVHDLSEIETGDIPAPAKWKHPELKAAANAVSQDWEYKYGLRYRVTEQEQKLLSWADMAEFTMYAIEEVTMGNQFFVPYLVNAISNLANRQVPPIFPIACESLLVSLVTEAASLGAPVVHPTQLP